jgi:hypothetical protein
MAILRSFVGDSVQAMTRLMGSYGTSLVPNWHMTGVNVVWQNSLETTSQSGPISCVLWAGFRSFAVNMELNLISVANWENMGTRPNATSSSRCCVTHTGPGLSTVQSKREVCVSCCKGILREYESCKGHRCSNFADCQFVGRLCQLSSAY